MDVLLYRVTARITPRAEKHLEEYFGNQFVFSNRIVLSSKPSELKSHPGSWEALGKKGELGEVWQESGLESKVKSGCRLTKRREARLWLRQNCHVGNRIVTSAASGRC